MNRHEVNRELLFEALRLGNSIIVEAVENYATLFPDHISNKLHRVVSLLGEVKEEVRLFEIEKKKLANDTVVRVKAKDPSGKYWLMNHKEKGWSSYGIPYKNLYQILDEWDCIIGAKDEDEFGIFFYIIRG